MVFPVDKLTTLGKDEAMILQASVSELEYQAQYPSHNDQYTQ